MKKKFKNNTGFTLAELLIVVAIIAVLVAIAIPIFTTQLEKSREATDLANVRAAYAEVMMAAITGDTSATYTGDSNQKIYKTDSGNYSVIVQPLKQKKDNWQMSTPITIGGVSSDAGDTYWRGIPGAGGYCEITYHPAAGNTGEYVSFYWTGGGDSENGNNSNIPTPTPSAPTNNDTISSIANGFGYIVWPENDATINLETGQIIYYNGNYYIYADITKIWTLTQYYHPTPEQLSQSNNLIKPGKVHTSAEVDFERNPPIVTNLVKGDLYTAEDGRTYIYKAESDIQTVPTVDASQWVQIKKAK